MSSSLAMHAWSSDIMVLPRHLQSLQAMTPTRNRAAQIGSRQSTRKSSSVGSSGDLSALLRIFGGRVVALLKTPFETVEFSLKAVELGPLGLQLPLRS